MAQVLAIDPASELITFPIAGEGPPSYPLYQAADWWECFDLVGGEKNWAEPEPLYEFELCDGWMYSVYEVEFELVAEDANNIHVVIGSSGDFRVDSVVVDAHWYTSPYAAGPTPLDGAEDVAIGTCLEWYEGCYADEHDIYFGTEIVALAPPSTHTAVNPVDAVELIEDWFNLDWVENGVWLEDFNGDPGVWHLIGDAAMEFSLANYDINDPNKIIDLHIIWQSANTRPEGEFWAWGEEEDSVNWGDANLTGESGPGGLGWMVSSYRFVLEPNPVGEIITLTCEEANDIYIAEVIIETDCNGRLTYNEWDLDANDGRFGEGPPYATTQNVGNEEYCPALDVATEYFWRITEVNDACDGSPWIGSIWSFTTQAYKVIDDFESYADTDALKLVWEDRSTLLDPDRGGMNRLKVSPEPVHGGTQSMQLEYAPSYGNPVARRTYPDDDLLDVSAPFKALVLWFYGETKGASTPADEIYVTLKDSAGASGDEATVHYGDTSCVYSGDADASDLIAEEWMKWAIPLSAFEDDNGNIDLDQIKNITLGTSGGTGGYVYFDDILVYGRYCHTEYSWRFGDFTGPDGVPDCAVDGEDLGVMGDDWLETDSEILVVAPCDVNLIVEYTFNNNTLADTAGDANNGIDINTVSLHDGMLTLGAEGGVEDWVEVPINANIFNSPFTVVMEVRMEEVTGYGNVLLGVCPPTPNDPCVTSTSYMSYDYAITLFHCVASEFGDDTVVRDHSFISPGGIIEESGAADGEWHTVVTTSDGSSEQVTYVITAGEELMSGENLDFQVAGPNLGLPERHKVMIGHSYHPAYSDITHDEFMGATSMVGDVNIVQIYNYTMPLGHVLSLLYPDEIGTMHYQPLVLATNLYPKTGGGGYNPDNLDIVNFKDFAVLSDNWLMDAFWP